MVLPAHVRSDVDAGLGGRPSMSTHICARNEVVVLACESPQDRGDTRQCTDTSTTLPLHGKVDECESASSCFCALAPQRHVVARETPHVCEGESRRLATCGQSYGVCCRSLCVCAFPAELEGATCASSEAWGAEVTCVGANTSVPLGIGSRRAVGGCVLRQSRHSPQ